MECILQRTKNISLKYFELQKDGTAKSRQYGHNIRLLSFVKKEYRDKHTGIQSEVSRSLQLLQPRSDKSKFSRPWNHESELWKQQTISLSIETQGIFAHRIWSLYQITIFPVNSINKMVSLMDKSMFSMTENLGIVTSLTWKSASLQSL